MTFANTRKQHCGPPLPEIIAAEPWTARQCWPRHSYDLDDRGQLDRENINPRQIAARPRETGDVTKPRVFGDKEDNGGRRGCRLDGEYGGGTAGRDHGEPFAAPIPSPASAADRSDRRPSGIRQLRSRPR